MKLFIKKNGGVLFLLGILLVGLLTIAPYGAYLDQTAEQRILFANIEEYCIQFGAEDTQLVQDLKDFGVLPISIDEDRDHGMAVYYPAFIVWFLNQESLYAGSMFWHIYTFLINFWGMCSLFLLGKELFKNEKIAAVTTLLFFLSPRMFAESHYNNKDVVLLGMVITMFYWTMRLMKEKSVKSLFMLAFVGALAANMKIIGAWYFGMLGLYALIYFIATKQMDKKLALKAVSCILLWIGLVILLTPGCWGNMVDFFEYLFLGAVDYNLWHDYVLFNGKLVHQDYTGMPKKYLPVLILFTTPIGILLLVVAGSIFALVDLWKKKGDKWSESGFVLMMLFIGLVPLAYAVLAATPLYNGWRHFYFVYASMLVAMGYGVYRIWEILKKRGCQKVGVVAITGYLAVLAIGIAINYPQEHSYFNMLAGKDVVEKYELDYWDMSVRQAFDSILEAEDEPVVVSALNVPTHWGLEEIWKFCPEKMKEQLILTSDWKEWQDADYVIINTTYAVMYSQENYAQVKAQYELIDTFTSYGHIICEVYKK